jgi:hypothetical protein
MWRIVIPLHLACLTVTMTSWAQWLVGTSREISRADSAAPDAPITSLGFGPRARGSIGLDVALLARRRDDNAWRVGVVGLVAAEDFNRRDPFPAQALRTNIEIGTAFPFTGAALTKRSDHRALELGIGLGHSSATVLPGNYLIDPYHGSDMPFGGGGWYLSTDAAARLPMGRGWDLTSRMGLRLFTNAFPDAVGAHVASDHVADQLREGAQWQTNYEIGARWRACASAQPLARAYLDVIQPHDDSAKHRWLGRLLVGLALPGESFELTPFIDAEAGHGSGILINRSELRLGAGVRLYAR